MKQVLKLLRFKNKDRYLLINTFILLGLIKLGLWLLPFQILRQILGSISQPNTKLDQTSLSKITWAVNVSTRYMPNGAKCLARALACQVLMTRRGYSPELRIGVAKSEEGKLEAHAWVESQGQVVIGYLTDLPRFTQLPSLPGNRL
ncbi:lasso peptide biosynthesis B2 protein [Nostoc sp. MG11]|uniref:lasso peptide biosynthesis B2 protein n=1 Tax=Nostoc sp. MG11 TaxID=2721166 RepID=UPI00186952AC|nr:lasso peptide biosynthesis B2 protein [Nostoc sp. MG11]